MKEPRNEAIDVKVTTHYANKSCSNNNLQFSLRLHQNLCFRKITFLHVQIISAAEILSTQLALEANVWKTNRFLTFHSSFTTAVGAVIINNVIKWKAK